jgi:hypothetical protein
MHFISISNVAKAWDKVRERCVNDAWGKLCPEFAHVVRAISKEILVMAKHVGFIE